MSGQVILSSTAEWPPQSSSESSSTTPPLNNGRRPGGRSESSTSVSASQVFTKWLMKKQANNGSDNDGSGLDNYGQPVSSISPVGVGIVRGQLFPAKLALALGMAKTLLGVLLVAFGALALWEQASMSYLGSGELSSYTWLMRPLESGDSFFLLFFFKKFFILFLFHNTVAIKVDFFLNSSLNLTILFLPLTIILVVFFWFSGITVRRL